MNKSITLSRLSQFILFFSLLIFPLCLMAQVEELEEFGEEDSAQVAKCKPDSLTTPYDKFRADSITTKQIQIWYSFGSEEFKHQQYKRAIPYYWKVLVNDTTDTYRVVYRKLATCYFELTKTNGNEGSYLDSTLLVIYRGLEQYPDYARLHYRAGNIYRTLGKVKCAIPHYEALVEAYPDQKNYWQILAELLFQVEDDRCIEIQQKVVSMDPDDNEANNLLVQWMRYFGKDPLEAMKAAFLNDTTNVRNAMQYGTEAYVVGSYKEALRAFKAIQQVDPENIEALDYLAKSYEGLDNTRQAIQVYKDILEIDPKNIDALCSIALAYSRLHEFSSARYHIIQAKRIDPKNGRPYMVMAEIYENAVAYCTNKRESSESTYDDKLVYEKAIQEYQMAARDPNYKSTALTRINGLEPFKRTKAEIHLHSARETIKDGCYDWIQ